MKARILALLLGAAPAAAASAEDMSGIYGPYPMARESSGTAWVPDSTPLPGTHLMRGDWMTMLHGAGDVVYDDQGGPRGSHKTFLEGMLMGMASHPLAGGTIGFRGMLSPDPLMGRDGYPLLLQTGETANGTDPLIDRQHPHNLFSELAVSYSHPLTPASAAFLYVGYPAEPALGPPAFLHRFSGMEDPEAPITHHWLDSTHITFGVATVGIAVEAWKIEGSVFTGREPDQYRYGFNHATFNSYSARVSYNPGANWSLQLSNGYLKSPEQLTPNVNQHRTTASAIYNFPFLSGNWQTTLAWGVDDNSPGAALNAFMLESALTLRSRHTLFARAEHVAKDELFTPPDSGLPTASPLYGRAFNVNKFSAGYIYEIAETPHSAIGVGGLGSFYGLPQALSPSYGSNPVSFMLFVRAKVG